MFTYNSIAAKEEGRPCSSQIELTNSGASRGIGRELALQLATIFSDTNSTFFLIARNEKGLSEVKQKIIKELVYKTYYNFL